MHVPGAFRTAVPILAAVSLTASARPPLVDYPAGFRQWTHVTSGVNGSAHGPYEGMYHIYANAKAIRGYRSGKFPDGAMIAFDLHEAQLSGEATQPAGRKFVDVMQKDSKLFRSTDGWGYEKFVGGDPQKRRLPPEAMKRCHSCHVAKQSSDFVISRFRD
jgi:hypothetical protein